MPIYLEGDKHLCIMPSTYGHKPGTIWQCTCGKFYLLSRFDIFDSWAKISRRKAERLKYKAWKKKYR